MQNQFELQYDENEAKYELDEDGLTKKADPGYEEVFKVAENEVDEDLDIPLDNFINNHLEIYHWL